MTTDEQPPTCPCCGYFRPAEPCAVCGGQGAELYVGGPLRVGRRNPLVEFVLGVDDVRRAGLAVLFGREFVGILRVPVLANLAASVVLALLVVFWLLPAFDGWFAQRDGLDGYAGPHLWLLAAWFAAGPALLDLMTSWSLDPIRRATEQHMLGATPKKPPRRGPRLLERLELLLLAAVAAPLLMALVLIPWVGLLLTVTIGSALTALIWLQPPAAVRGLPLAARLKLLLHNPWRALGTGFGLQLAVAVPFANVLGWTMAATIAGTSAYLHFDKAPKPATGPAAGDRKAAS